MPPTESDTQQDKDLTLAVIETLGALGEEGGTAVRFVTSTVREWRPVVAGLPPMEELRLRTAIAAKIARCYALVQPAEKGGQNTVHNFKYASAEAIMAVARAGLAEAKLAVVPMMGEFRDLGGNDREHYLQQDYVFAVMDGETGYTLAIPWESEVLEGRDKGLGKLLTYGLKTFLRAFLLIPLVDAEEDPDNHGGTDSRPQGGQGGQRRNPPAQPRNRPATEPAPVAAPQAPPAEEDPLAALRAAADKLIKDAFPGLRDGKETQARKDAEASMGLLKEKARKHGYKVVELAAYLSQQTQGPKDGQALLMLAARSGLKLPSLTPDAPGEPLGERRAAAERLAGAFQQRRDAVDIIKGLDRLGTGLTAEIEAAVVEGVTDVEAFARRLKERLAEAVE